MTALRYVARGSPSRNAFVWLVGLVLAMFVITWASGALPPAGSVIGNQANATYTDSGGQTKTATSNLVETVVQQVGSFTLVQDNTKTAAPGNVVYMPHTLTNTGNGSDSFTLAFANLAGSFDVSTITVYADANGDGVPDSTTALCASPCTTGVTTPNLPAGGTFKFVIALGVPASALGGQNDQVSVTATPVSFPATPTTITNTDTVNVTTGAAFQVTKSILPTQGPTGRTVTFRLSYTNIGAAAGTLALRDVIGESATAGFEYVAGTAVWSAGPTNLSDAAEVAPAVEATVGAMTIAYKAITVGTTTTMDTVITGIAPNVSGIISFTVNVRTTALPGVSTTTNIASYGPDTSNLVPTNPATYNVQSNFLFVLNNGTSSTDGLNTRPGSAETDPLGNRDLAYVATASAGRTVSFENTVWNTGNQTDTFNITASKLDGPSPTYGTWPVGTTVQLMKSDGATPLLDTNGDGIPDTGAVAPAGSYKVIVKVTLPANACGAGACPTGPFDIEKAATSVGNPSALANKTYDRLGTISKTARVDIANSTGGTDTTTAVWTAENQDAIGASPTTTKTTLPAQPVAFDLFVRNEGPDVETYDLRWSGSNFASGAGLPAGWTVEFRSRTNGVCSATGGTALSKIGPIPGYTEWLTCAVVTPPAGAAAGTTSVYFQVSSQATGAVDTKWDAVTVQSINALALAPNHTGQVAPGGTVVYAHTLTNTGNSACTSTFTFSISETLAASGWTYAVYLDVNGDGNLDSGDTSLGAPPVLTSSALAVPGGQVKLLVKVFAPAGTTAGVTDVVQVSVTGTCGGVTTTAQPVTDTTTVITGQIRLVKTQAKGACNSTLSSLTFSTNQLVATPGSCLFYQIVATNEGTTAVTLKSISDALPAYTGINSAATPNPSCQVGTGTPSAGTYTAPVFSCDFPTTTSIPPGGTATMWMSVQLTQ